MWAELAAPVVIAHRGDQSRAPENTLPAFKLAAEAGAPAIEFDVKLSSDGQVVVIHDPTVDRTTDGRGEVRKLSLADLRSLDAGAWYQAAFAGTRLPTLDEVCEEVGRRLHLNVELTNYATPGDDLVDRVVAVVRRHGLEERVLFSSFFASNLRRARRLLPEVPRALLAWPGWMGAIARGITVRSAGYFALHPNLKDTGVRLVAGMHAAGRRVNVWTVNGETDLRAMLALGVDGIFTDDPRLALRLAGAG